MTSGATAGRAHYANNFDLIRLPAAPPAPVTAV